MYTWIRIAAAILLASPIVLIPLIRHVFAEKRSVYIVSACCAALMLGTLLFQWPFENYFGGFPSAERAYTYQYGKTDWHYTIEDTESAMVLSGTTSGIFRKEQGAFLLVSPRYTTRQNGFSEDVSVVIRGDQRTQERFVQVAMLETDRTPSTISDNKGTRFEKAFDYNGFTYYLGSFRDDGLSYTLYVDGYDVGLMKLS